MTPARLLSPRATAPAYDDVGERPSLIARQRVRRVAALRRRRRARPLRAALIGLGAGLPLILGGLLVHFTLTSERFMVAEVEVEGASRLHPAAIVQAAGIAPGTSLFLLDAVAVSGRVEVLPGIRRAEVVRAWPNRVRIVVDERRPFTLVHAGRLHWVDEEGVALGEERQAVMPPSPVISGLSPEEVASMRTHPSPRAQAGITLIRLLLRRGSPLLTEVSEIDLSRADGPVLFTVDGVEVRLGAEDWENRLGRLEAVLGQIAGSAEPVTSIDLRFRDQVVLNGGGAR
jgi:cell division septal protein FtsQ